MRFLTRALPPLGRVLLVESGSRRIIETAIPRLQKALGEKIEFDLLTCYSGTPAGLSETSRVWRTQEHSAPDSRQRLLRELGSRSATVLAIVCSNEAVMTRWKWWLFWKLPAKTLVINENADFFWLDRGNLGTIRRVILLRLGFQGASSLEVFARLLAMPFVFGYLLLYATSIHARRALRLAFSRHSAIR